jgi:3-phenylpropionate/trans-cinnamate dioxygenase ferredoxin reductase subunit
MTETHIHGGMLIVGGGECGARAAVTLREKGWAGAITLVGRETLHAYERPPLSKTAMTSEACEPVHPFAKDQFDTLAIDLRTSSEVARIEPHRHQALLSDGAVIGYDKLLLAVGAQPRRLPFPAKAGLLYLRTHADALRIKSELVPGRQIGILGAGLIGLELAASARALGCEVTVIEAADRALGRAVPAPVAAQVTALHESQGVQFRWSTTVEQLDRIDEQLIAHTSDGKLLRFDVISVGIGAAPDISLAQVTGLAIDNGIAVDDRLRTSSADVFAAGDCASFPHPLFDGRRIRVESWRNAHNQAVTAAANMLGADQPYTAIPGFWSDQYDHTLQVTGLSALTSELVARTRDDSTVVHFGLDSGGRLVCASGFGPGSSVARDIKLAEKIIEEVGRPTTADLAASAVPLKALLTSVARSR